MKKILGSLLSIVCVACFSTASMTSQATETKTHKTATTHSSSAASKSTSKTKKSTTKSSASSKKKSSKTSTTESSVKSTCKSVRVKTSKGYHTERKCTTTESALHSPIGAGEIDSQSSAGKQPELKARTIPDRAYAVDGYTFFHQGRKYRIVGIDEALIPAGSDLAKQRLQLALDSGPISVEPETVDENGTMRAVVRIGGKNLADVLNASH
jgi:endonuclease YncB( thermonuclease family)